MPREIDDMILWNALVDCEELHAFYEYDIDIEEFRQALNRITKLTINIKRGDELTEETLEQLNLLLDHMKNLKELRINNRFNERVEISPILEHITSNIELISFYGLDLTNGVSHTLAEKLTEMKYFSVSECNIPQIPVFPKDGCMIVLGEGITEISDKECIEFGTNSQINNSLSTDKHEEAMKVIKAYKGQPFPLALYQKYKEFIPRFGDICISISDVSKLSLEQLEELETDSHIKNIAIEGGCYDIDDEKSWYSLDEYAEVRKEIDQIISQVKLPEHDDPNREKKIFTQVYKLLGKRISYDHCAIDNSEGIEDITLQYNSRNMKNGLLGVERKGKKECLAICAGYSDILRNVLACFGINAEYVRSHSDVELVFQNGSYIEKKDENGKQIYRNGTTDPMGHAYNLVELDGQKFYCDLTWDANGIKVDRFPLHNFLNSYEQFLKSHASVGFNDIMADKNADFSLPFEEQLTLFGEVAKEEIAQMMEENYLSGFVGQYLESIAQGSEKIDSKKFLDMISHIKQVEQVILSTKENAFTNIGVTIGNERFIFETSDSSKLEDMKKDITRRRGREYGHESR